MAAERRDVAPFRHVVVATDFTPGATAAVQRALTLPIEGHGLIELVHVLPMDLPRKTRTTIRAEAAARLEAAASAARSAANRAHVTATIRSRLDAGPVPDTIVAHAKSTHAELVVIGRHGRRIVRDWFIGSTARRVAHRSPVPALIVNSEDATKSYYRPLAAIDPEAYPDTLLTTAARVLGDRPVVVRLVHAFHVPFESVLSRSMSARAIREERNTARGRAKACASSSSVMARRSSGGKRSSAAEMLA